MKKYTRADVCMLSGFTRERWKKFTIGGMINPRHHVHNTNTIRKYTIHEVYGVCIFKKLIDGGMHKKVANQAYEYYRDNCNSDTEEFYFPLIDSHDAEGESLSGVHLYISRIGEIKHAVRERRVSLAS